MSASLIGLVCIAGMLLLIVLRCPVALAMAVTGFVGFGWIVAFGPAVAILDTGPFETLSNYGFSPIPMFILMGCSPPRRACPRSCFPGRKNCSVDGGEAWRLPR